MIILINSNDAHLKIELTKVDDCLKKIRIQNPYQSFTYNIITINCFYCNPCNKYICPLIDISYKFGDSITFEIHNNEHIAYIQLYVLINEYTIDCSHEKFWKCTNCYENGKYDKINEYFRFCDGSAGSSDFQLSLQINSSFDLDFKDNNVSSNFYALKNHIEIINITTYDIDNEIKLINFYNTSYFYIENNKHNIAINYDNYYFKIYFEKNSFNGTLIGLNLSNSLIELYNDSSFKSNKSKGLFYKLSKKEKRQKGANISFSIEGYNSIKNVTFSKRVTNRASYIFNITIKTNYSVCLNDILPYYHFNESSMSYYICFNLSKEEIINNMSKIMLDTEIGKNYIIKGNNITINIYPLNSTFLDLLMNLNFSKCENTIRGFYGLPMYNIITFVKFEIIINSLRNQTLYQAYSNNNTLDLSICNDLNINISQSLEFSSLYSISPIFPSEYFIETTNIDTTYIDILSSYISPISTNIFNISKINDNNPLLSFENMTKEELVENLPLLMKEIKIGENYEIKGSDYNMKISPTNKTYLSYVTHVDFEKCEKKLRNYYNISDHRYITFVQLEIYNTNEKVLINKVEYKAYDENKNPLELSLCFNEEIKVVHSIKSSSLFDVISATSFKELGIDIFNINDSFFTDVCHSYSNSKNDMTLKDRIKEIFQNFSLCEENCFYDEINLVNMTITCDCRVKTNISLDNITENLINYNAKSNNFQIIKCYNLVFSLKDKLFNIGFWIFLILVTAHIPLLIIYFYQGIKPIREYIFHEMIKYGYINKKDENKNKKDKKNNKRERINKLSGPPRDKKSYNNIKNNGEASRKYLVVKNNESLLNLNKNNKNKKGEINSKNKKKKSRKPKINNILTTEKNTKRKKSDKNLSKKDKSHNIYNFNIININIKNKDNQYTPKESKQILNNYTFEQAIKYDYRSICLIYYIILLSKQPIFHAFLFKSPLELFSIRLCLLLFIYSSDLALNALFYLDDKISEKYHYAQNFFLFAFSNNITVILLSTFTGFLFMTLFTNLSNSTNEMRNIFREEEEKLTKNKKYNVSDKRKKEIINEIEKILTKFKIKIIILIIIEFSLMLFFWYYVTAFCHVYNSTQYSWLFDSFLSILSRSVVDFLVPMGFAKLYRMAIESNVYCLYKIALFFYSFA